MADRTSAGLESYAHSGAKRLLVDWLRDAAEHAGLDGHADFAGFTWRVNRPGPSWGILEECPVMIDGVGAEPVWDEVSPRWEARPPTYAELVADGQRPFVVLDVAVQHKGSVALAIEIKHKHGCDPRKVHFLRSRMSLIEVPAYWVLGQVDRPHEIPGEFWLS